MSVVSLDASGAPDAVALLAHFVLDGLPVRFDGVLRVHHTAAAAAAAIATTTDATRPLPRIGSSHASPVASAHAAVHAGGRAMLVALPVP